MRHCASRSHLDHHLVGGLILFCSDKSPYIAQTDICQAHMVKGIVGQTRARPSGPGFFTLTFRINSFGRGFFNPTSFSCHNRH